MIKHIKNMFKKSIRFQQTLPGWKIGQPHFREWNEQTAVKYGYKKSAIVYACVNLLAKSAASVTWKTYRRNSAGAWEEVAQHPLTQLIEKPNPYMSKKDLIERMTHGLYMGGNSINTKVRANNGAVVELWPINNDAVNVIPSRNNFIDHYLYDADGVKIRLDPKDIIHNQFLDPSNPFWGLAPIKAAAAIIDTDNEAIKWNMQAMQNRAISDGAFIFNEPLTREQWEEARQQIKEQHTGSDNAREFWVLGAGSTWQPMSMTPAEMDFIESRRYSRTEICSIFQVPPPLISIYDDATLANISTARKIFWLDTMLPFLSDIRSCFNASLTPEFGEDLFLDFDTSTIDAIQENQKEKFENAKTLFAMGVPFNQINQKLDLGFDEVAGGDIGFLPANLVPADMFNMQSNAQSAAQPAADDAEKGKTPGQHKAPEMAVKAVNLKTEEHKTFYWKSLERRRYSYDLSMTRKAARLFKDMGTAAAAAYENGGAEAVDKAIEAEREKWQTLFKSTWQSIYEEFAPEMYQQILDQAHKEHGSYDKKDHEEVDEPEDAFNPYEADILRYITTTAALKVTGVLDFTKAEIAAIVFDAAEQDLGMREVAAAIKNKFEDFSRYRSYMIARTEVAGASNSANYSAGQKAQERLQRRGVKLLRVWVTARDSRVRDSHARMEGKIVGMEEPFSMEEEDEDGNIKEVGKLNYPAEYEADLPSNTINCRCTIAYETRRV